MPSLTCREFVEFLDRYLSRELPVETRARFEEHLAACPTCSAYASTYRETVALARRAFDCDEQPVSGVPEELVLAILAATKHPE
jgi:anti-sigma factor RsiW